MIVLRVAAALVTASALQWCGPATAHAQAFAQLDAVAVAASPTTCGGTIRGEAQVVPIQVDERVGNGVRVTVNYDAGTYDGSCALTVTAGWTNLDSGATGSADITAVSTIDAHYGFIGYANSTFDTGPGTVVVELSSHPGAEMRITVY